jgi:RNA recognition motif-containing protein
VSCIVQTHADTGRPKGWALVKYSTPSQAQFAVSQFNQQELHERQLNVRLDRAKLEDLGGTIIFVGNLAWSCTEAELYEIFAEYEPAEVRIKTTSAGKSRGFALMRFENAEKAARAISKNGITVGDRQIEVREDKPAEERQKNNEEGAAAKGGKSGGKKGRNNKGKGTKGGADKSTPPPPPPSPCLNLYVNNLNWNSTDDDLFQHFCSAGVTPLSAKVQMNQTNGRSRGWGLVTYNSVEDAERALNQLNKSVLDERKISVRFDAKAEEDK